MPGPAGPAPLRPAAGGVPSRAASSAPPPSQESGDAPRPRQRQCPARPRACYHVLNRGHNREVVFADEPDRLYFLDLLARYRARFGLRLYHYCLMTNHFHLLLEVQAPRLLSKAMAGLLRAYVHHFNRRYGFVGDLWQRRFKSPAIGADTHLLSCGRYTERNP